MNFGLNHVKADFKSVTESSTLQFEQREYYDTYLLCKAYFDNSEYLRYYYITKYIWLSEFKGNLIVLIKNFIIDLQVCFFR